MQEFSLLDSSLRWNDGCRTHRFLTKQSESGVAPHELVFYDWGDVNDPTPIICVHGLTRNARDFNWIASALAAKNRRVLALSMAGRGESAWLPNPLDYTYATYVADCLSILDNFHLRQVDWIGTSMGGIIGMTIASIQPDRIRKLVLNDIGATLKKSALERIFTNVRSIPAFFATRAEAESYMRKAYAPFGLNSEQQWQDFFAISLQKTQVPGTVVPSPQGREELMLRLACDPRIIAPIARDTKDFTEIAEVNLAEIWKTIQIPTFILRGEQSDILDAETVSAMRATNLQADSVTIPNVGHAPALMDDVQIRIVTNWLLGGTPPIRHAGL